MSDTQSAMREFRFLDEKRKTNGLTAPEEQRWQELGMALGMDLSAQLQPQGYYGEDGLWYQYPPGYDPNQHVDPNAQWQQQQVQQQWDPNTQQYYAQQPGQPWYDPNTGQWYPAEQAYPQQQQWVDPSQQQQGWYDQATGQWYPAQQQQQMDPYAQQQQWGYPQQPQPVAPPAPTWNPPAPIAAPPAPTWNPPAPVAAPPAPAWNPPAPVAAPPAPVAPAPQPSAPRAPVFVPPSFTIKPKPSAPSSLLTPSAPAPRPPAAAKAPAELQDVSDDVMEIGDEEVLEIQPAAEIVDTPMVTLSGKGLTANTAITQLDAATAAALREEDVPTATESSVMSFASMKPTAPKTSSFLSEADVPMATESSVMSFSARPATKPAAAPLLTEADVPLATESSVMSFSMKPDSKPLLGDDDFPAAFSESPKPAAPLLSEADVPLATESSVMSFSAKPAPRAPLAIEPFASLGEVPAAAPAPAAQDSDPALDELNIDVSMSAPRPATTELAPAPAPLPPPVEDDIDVDIGDDAPSTASIAAQVAAEPLPSFLSEPPPPSSAPDPLPSFLAEAPAASEAPSGDTLPSFLTEPDPTPIAATTPYGDPIAATPAAPPAPLSASFEAAPAPSPQMIDEPSISVSQELLSEAPEARMSARITVQAPPSPEMRSEPSISVAPDLLEPPAPAPLSASFQAAPAPSPEIKDEPSISIAQDLLSEADSARVSATITVQAPPSPEMRNEPSISVAPELLEPPPSVLPEVMLQATREPVALGDEEEIPPTQPKARAISSLLGSGATEVPLTHIKLAAPALSPPVAPVPAGLKPAPQPMPMPGAEPLASLSSEPIIGATSTAPPPTNIAAPPRPASVEAINAPPPPSSEPAPTEEIVGALRSAPPPTNIAGAASHVAAGALSSAPPPPTNIAVPAPSALNEPSDLDVPIAGATRPAARPTNIAAPAPSALDQPSDLDVPIVGATRPAAPPSNVASVAAQPFGAGALSSVPAPSAINEPSHLDVAAESSGLDFTSAPNFAPPAADWSAPGEVVAGSSDWNAPVSAGTTQRLPAVGAEWSPAPLEVAPAELDVEPMLEGTVLEGTVEPLLDAEVEVAAPAPTQTAWDAPPTPSLTSSGSSFDLLAMAPESAPRIPTFARQPAPPPAAPPAVAVPPAPAPTSRADMFGSSFDASTEDFGGAPGDSVQLATNSDFIAATPAADVSEDISIDADPGEFVVENASAAELATNVRAGTAPEPPQEKLELASNFDFIDNSQLTGTGQQWKDDRASIPLEKEEEEEVIQGTVLEEEPPQDSWAVAVSQPSPVPVTRAPPPPPAPAPAPVAAAPQYAAPPPRPAVPSLGGEPPARVATPIAAPPQQQQNINVTQSQIPGGPVASPTAQVAPDQRQPVPVPGEHRVILHTVEGQVKRGAIKDARLGDAQLHLHLANGGTETLARERVKALFFMLAPGARAPATTGAKVRVTFKDGRQVAGFSADHKAPTSGFFVVPADNRTNTERIFIFRHAVQTVSVEK